MRMVQAVVVFLLSLALAKSAASESTPDPRLTAFLKRFNSIDYDGSKYNHPDSMFFPYREKQFADGLPAREQVALKKASTGLNCRLAQTLLARGFLNLFPFLTESFQNPIMFDQLAFRLQYARLPELERCDALESLLQVARTNPDAVRAPVKMLEEFLGREVYSIHPLRQEPRSRLISAWYTLGKLAFCENYLPAIKDVLSRSHRNGGIALTRFDTAYLLGQIANRSVRREIYKAAMEATELSSDEREIMVATVKKTRRYHITELYYTGGNWQVTCSLQ